MGVNGNKKLISGRRRKTAQPQYEDANNADRAKTGMIQVLEEIFNYEVEFCNSYPLIECK
jgi:hypothetical protein